MLWALIIIALISLVIENSVNSFFKERSEKRSHDRFIQKINDPENRERLFQKRVKELGLNLDQAIEVLLFSSEDESNHSVGYYVYMWDGGGALALFPSTKIFGKSHWVQSPSEQKVEYIERNQIKGFYKRNGYCVIVTTTEEGNYRFSLQDHDQILNLLSESSLIDQ